MRLPKKLLLLAVLLTAGLLNTAIAQQDKSKRPSPPATAEASMDGLEIKISYSQPAVKGRQIWGKLVPYGKIWRTGANEATTFEVSEDVRIEGELLPAGTYALLSIPGETEWTFIFNKKPEQWGAYNYNPDDDALRVTVTPGEAPDFAERLTFRMDDAGTVHLHWEKRTVAFTVKKA